MSTHHIKRIGIGLAAGVVLAILFSLDTATDFQNTTRTAKPETHPTVRRPQRNEGMETLKPFQDSDFYRTIIDNNIFRPLGWTPPRPTEPYRLMGTILPCSENTPPTAIIQSTAGNTTYIVTTGEPLDASTEVVSIEAKQVVLSTNGQRRTLKLPSGF